MPDLSSAHYALSAHGEPSISERKLHILPTSTLYLTYRVNAASSPPTHLPSHPPLFQTPRKECRLWLLYIIPLPSTSKFFSANLSIIDVLLVFLKLEFLLYLQSKRCIFFKSIFFRIFSFYQDQEKNQALALFTMSLLGTSNLFFANSIITDVLLVSLNLKSSFYPQSKRCILSSRVSSHASPSLSIYHKKKRRI